MRNKFIRYSLLMSCASFTLSNAYAMEPAPTEDNKGVQVAMTSATHSQIPLEGQWKIEEQHKKTYYAGFDLSKKITIRSLQQGTYIEDIHIGVINKKDDIFVCLNPFSCQKGSKQHKILKAALRVNKISYTSQVEYDNFKITCADKITPGKFLSVFYNRDLIPDFVIDRIIKHIGIEDFRMNTDSMIARIKEQMTRNPTTTDIKRIVFGELATIKDPVRRATITWGVVQELKGAVDRQLIMSLCDQISSQDLPFFKEASLLQAQLEFSDGSLGKVGIEARYKSPLIRLITINGLPEAQIDLNAFVKAFINNDTFTTEPLEEDLQNLDSSAESIYRLLNVLRNKNIALKALQEKK